MVNSNVKRDPNGRNNITILAFVLFVLAGCASQTPVLDMSPDAEVTFDGLREIKDSIAGKAWAKPGLNLSGYSKIMIQGAGIEYRPGGAARRSIANSADSQFALTEEQKARFKEVVGEVFLKELGESEKFTLVNEPGPDVLLIRGGLLDVVSYVPPEPIGRSDIYLREIGAVTLVLEIRDSMTDAIYVRAVDRNAIGNNSMMMQSSRVLNTSEVKRTIARWASMLRSRLDSFSGYTSVAS